MKSKPIKASFRLPRSAAEWAGQALYSQFPDGLLITDASPRALLSGWPRGVRPSQLEELREHLSRLGATAIRFTPFSPRDWARDYKARFPVQRLGRFTILPAWKRRAALPKASLPIVLLPGQAFGTGLHASTRLMLEGIAGRQSSLAGRQVLDIGAGSGILGLACLRLGAKTVTAVELEEAACEEMKGNRKLNGFAPGRMKVLCGAFPAVGRGKADLVLANIVTPVLVKLMPKMKAALRPGGELLMSGIHTADEAETVAAAARRAGLKISNRRSKGEWRCLYASR